MNFVSLKVFACFVWFIDNSIIAVSCAKLCEYIILYFIDFFIDGKDYLENLSFSEICIKKKIVIFFHN